MCGRFSQLPSQSPFQAPKPELNEALMSLPVRYNLAPSQTAGVLIQPHDEIALHILQWGLLPFWAKDINLAQHTINARIETVNEKPSFRAALKSRHAVIPMSGYYEWQATPQGKQPYYFQAEKLGEFLWIAGLWEPRHPLQTDSSDGTFTLITQPATGIPAQVHTRMPVFMDKSDVDEWLQLRPGPTMPFLLTRTLPALKVHAVSKRVNNGREDDAGLIEPITIP
jgi:putative SOS response-associated peptidase YedK